MKLEIRVIRNFNELDGYLEQWNDILEENRNDNPYVTPDWLMGWWRFFGEGWEPCILILIDGTQPVGFVPLMSRVKKLYCEYRIIGYPKSGRFNFIVRQGYERIFAQNVATHLTALPGTAMFMMHGLIQGDPCYGYLLETLGGRRRSIRTLECSIVNLTGGWAEFIKTKRRHNAIRRTLSREQTLNGICDLRYEEVSPRDMDVIFAIHDKRWQKRNDGSSFSRGASRAFFTWLAEGKPSAHWDVHVHILKAGRLPIGFVYGIECNGRFIYYRIAHDDDFAYFKPGMITTERILQRCFEWGTTKFDFSTGDEQYKKLWADESEWIDRLTFGTDSPMASFFVTADHILWELRQRLKKNRVLLHFKRETTGRIKYFLSGKSVKTFLDRARNIIGLQGLTGLRVLIPCALSRRFPAEGLRIYTTQPAQWVEKSGAVCVRTAELDEVGMLSELTVLPPQTIVERYAKGNRCLVFTMDDRPVGRAWSSESDIKQGETLLWHPIRPGDRCCYDICVFTHRNDSLLRDVLIALAAHPLPRPKNALTLSLHACNNRLVRAAENLGFDRVNKKDRDRRRSATKPPAPPTGKAP